MILPGPYEMPPIGIGDIVAYRDIRDLLCLWTVEGIEPSMLGPGFYDTAILSFFGGFTIYPGWKREQMCVPVHNLVKPDLTPLELLAWAALSPFDD